MYASLKANLHQVDKFTRSEFFDMNAQKICAESNLRQLSSESQQIFRFAESRVHSYVFAAKFYKQQNPLIKAPLNRTNNAIEDKITLAIKSFSNNNALRKSAMLFLVLELKLLVGGNQKKHSKRKFQSKTSLRPNLFD